MKKRELYEFRDGLNSAKFEYPTCSYAVTKNKRLLKSVIKDMETYIEEDDQVKEFSKLKIELGKECAIKDEKGNAKTKIISGDKLGHHRIAYDIPDVDNLESKYRVELAKLEEQFKESLDRHKEKVTLYNEDFLNEESEFQPFMLDLKVLQEHEKCPQDVMDKIFYMIKE